MHCVEPIRNIKEIDSIKLILKNNPRNYLLFLLGINCGLRISDLLQLKVSDVINKEYIELVEKKTGKFKHFPITKSFKQPLNNYIKSKNENDYIFSNPLTHKPISRVQAYRIINSACHKVGITTKIGTHTLRKTFGYHFYKKNKDIALLQQILNHSSPHITLRYIGINQDILDMSLRDFAL